MSVYLSGARVQTVGLGPGVVITDWRWPCDLGTPRDTVWVLLDAGANPQPFKAAELTRLPERVAA